ncbi:MAG TPA: hypothetical protein VNV66_19265 [Pilimelia sp.]|nr:hypothetical protein [Pilimelia sp.]
MYAFPQIGVHPLRAAYRTLVDRLGIDATILVDGGTEKRLRHRNVLPASMGT